MKRKSNNQKKPEWYPVINKSDMKRLIHAQGILSWLDSYHIDQRIMAALEEDILEFINRACRAVGLRKLPTKTKKR